MWECIKLLLKILVIAHSHEVTENDLIDMELIAKQFLEQHRECTGLDMTPKLHLMLHYPDTFRMVGTVTDMSTIRYEAKHQVFKNI